MPSMKFQILKVLLLALFTEAYSEENLCLYRSLECPADNNREWTYRGQKGPSSWGIKYPLCNGEFQSPIDIRTDIVEKDETLSPLGFENYEQPATVYATNTGYIIKLFLYGDAIKAITVNGGKYQLEQMDFHFGCSCSDGSAHKISNGSFAMEIHFVHRNDNGMIAMVAQLAEEGDNNEELQKIVDKLPELQYKDEDDIKELGITDFDISKLLPRESPSYYRYFGSQSEPPCKEGLIWSVVTEPISIGRTQLAEFRKLYTSDKQNASPGCMMAYNFRPVQPLNCRKVKLYESQQE